jgi:phosphoadenosine phosphosulfate reductase
MKHLEQLKYFFDNAPVEEALRQTALLFSRGVKFSTSLGQEDQVITDIISRHNLSIDIFTLDTGRLFSETYDLLEKTRDRYKQNIDVYFPQTESVQRMVSEHGVNLFYDSVQNRQTCCSVRKVEPLYRALYGTQVWITGLRAAQTDFRKNLPVVEWLPDKEIYKISPLLHWSFDEVKKYIHQYSVPYNPLHDKGFVSIGCAPCTRAIEAGQDPRAGRWWWEASQKECGLHLVK